MTFDDRTATAFHRLALFCSDGTVFHISKRDHWPDRFAFIFQRINFRYAGRNFIAELIEYRLYVADLCP